MLSMEAPQHYGRTPDPKGGSFKQRIRLGENCAISRPQQDKWAHNEEGCARLEIRYENFCRKGGGNNEWAGLSMSTTDRIHEPERGHCADSQSASHPTLRGASMQAREHQHRIVDWACLSELEPQYFQRGAVLFWRGGPRTN